MTAQIVLASAPFYAAVKKQIGITVISKHHARAITDNKTAVNNAANLRGVAQIKIAQNIKKAKVVNTTQVLDNFWISQCCRLKHF
ncbi:hypothetical protein [Lelliottia sp.]|uniref:hypothetical protein n=1 Tax=Lelliottia sp. TaxID=1898429 RepID=UPI00388D44A2